MNSTAKKMRISADMYAGIHQMRVHAVLAEVSILNPMIGIVPGSSVKDAGCAVCHTPDRVESNRAAFIALGAKLTRDVAAMRPLVASAVEKTSLDTIDSEVANWTRLYGSYLDLAIHKDFQRAHEIMVGQIYLVLPKITEAADALNAEQEKLLAESRIAAEHQVALTFGEVSLAVALGLLAGVRRTVGGSPGGSVAARQRLRIDGDEPEGSLGG